MRFCFSLLIQQLCRKCTLVPVFFYVSALHANRLTLGHPDLFNLTETQCVCVEYDVTQFKLFFLGKWSVSLWLNPQLFLTLQVSSCKVNCYHMGLQPKFSVSACSLIPLGQVHKLTKVQKRYSDPRVGSY